MSEQRRYKVTDDRFARLAQARREQAALTQMRVAEELGVSVRTIRHWEGGTAFPTSANLRQMIALYLHHGGFGEGREREEAYALWVQADESAARFKAPFDEAWFDELLTSHRDRPVDTRPPERDLQASPVPTPAQREDWGGAPDAAALYGREHEIATLERWVLAEGCRVVALLGMGGIGKTLLAVKFAQGVAHQFSRVLWRSLRDAPPLDELLADCLRALQEQPSLTIPDKTETRVTLLIDVLRQQRCLLILDNVETLIEPGSLAGHYRAGCEGYGALFRRVAETAHKSCMLLTSREMLSELEPLEGANAPVRSLKLAGLSSASTQELLQDKVVFGPAEAWDAFTQLYSGSPLALKIAAAMVRDLFGGDLATYLREAPVTLYTLRQLLDDQFERLSGLEQRVLTWLAIARDNIGLEQLSAELSGSLQRQELLAALQALRRRSLVERSAQGSVFTLLPVVMEYVSDRLVAQFAKTIIQGEFGQLSAYPLMQSYSYDYIRESQSRMLVQPVLSRLITHFGSETAFEAHVRQLMQQLRELPAGAQGYAGGNLLNLLVHLRDTLRGWDLSQLVLRQAYLAEVEAQDANLAGSDVRHARFMEPFETISAMALSPDGRHIAVGSYSGQIRLWHVAEGKPLWSAKGDARRAWSLAFSPDSALLASGGAQGQVRLLDVSSGRLLQELPGHSGWVRTVAFSPDGQTLATAGDDATVRLWDIQQGLVRHVLRGHQGLIWSAAFSPDGASLFTGGADTAIRVWDVASGVCLRALSRHSESVFSVTAHPQGTLLASGSEDGQIFLWDLRSGQWLQSLDRRGTGPAVVAFNLEGTLLASGTIEGAIQLWDVLDARRVQYAITLYGHRSRASVVAFATGGLLATASYARSVRIWEARSGKKLRTLKGYSRLMTALAFSPDGRLLAQGDGRGIVRIWDLQSGRCLSSVEGHAGPIWCIAFNPNGRTFASCGEGREVKLWSAQNGQCLKTFTGHTSMVWALAFRPDGALLASAGTDREIRLWETGADGGTSEVKTLQGSPAWIWSLAFAPDGRTLASGGTTGEVKLWSVPDGQCIATFQQKESIVGALCFSPDGHILASSSNDELLTHWRLEDSRCLLAVPREALANRAKAVACDRDVTLVATTVATRQMQLWRLGQGGEELLTLVGLGGEVWSVAFSADRRLVAASNDEGAIALWDTTAGALHLRLIPDRPYERMDIKGLKYLNEAQLLALKAFGAVDGSGET